MAPAPLGIPWAEKWPSARILWGVAIRTLPVVSGGGYHAICRDRTFCQLLGTTYSRSPSAAPIHPPGRARTKALAAMLGLSSRVIERLATPNSHSLGRCRSVSPKIFEPVRRQGRMDRRARDRARLRSQGRVRPSWCRSAAFHGRPGCWTGIPPAVW